MRFASQDGSFSFDYPADFKAYSKPLKTHKQEVSRMTSVVACLLLVLDLLH